MNAIELVHKFVQLIAEVYKLESKTSSMDAITEAVDFTNANEVRVMKLSTVGLGNYSRTTGYPKGNITATWETMQLAIERGRAFEIDKMDNEESFGLVVGNLIRTWMREHVAPEIDAIRFAKYATGAGLTTTGATLNASTVLAAIDAAKLAMNEAEVPEEGRKLYASFTVKAFIEAAITRSLANESRVDRRVTTLDGIELVGVPQSRFYTGVTLNAGAESDAGGYVKTPSTGKDINFLLMHPNTVLQPVKLDQVKYFSPEVNQLSDGHLFQYRLYHDAFVYDNRENGIYLHKKA